MKRALFWAMLALAVSRAAAASQKSIQLPGDNALAALKPGPGVEQVRANCVPCHSTDYIVRQPGSDTQHWGAEVKKMITVFGAPISDSDANAIVDYLSAAYGPEAKPESAAPEKHPARLKRPKDRKQ